MVAFVVCWEVVAVCVVVQVAVCVVVGVLAARGKVCKVRSSNKPLETLE